MAGKLRYLILSCVALCMVANTGHADLVGHWKLDDGAGDVAADATGNGHDGSLIDGPTWVDGYINGALEFAGAGQKVDIPHSDELNPVDEFTVSLWANPASGGTGHRSPVTSRDDYPQRGYIIYVEPGNTWQYWTGIGTGWNNTPGPAAALDEWTYVTATYSDGQKGFYINGELVGEGTGLTSPNTQQVLRIGGGATESAGNYFFVGMVDDVRIYDHALSELEIAALMAGQSYPFAVAPGPKDGTMVASRQVLLEWGPGELAVSHNVYFGQDAEAVANATEEDATLFLGSTTDSQFQLGIPDGLIPGATYYWRIDEVNPDNPDSPWKGQVWSFQIQPVVAWNPSPGDGTEYVRPDQDMAWSAGMGALFHTVYFGESFEEVDTGAVIGFMTTEPTYDPGSLTPDKTYYWRVDEFSTAGTEKGEVWSFQTLPEIAVTDPSLLAWWKLDEGAGTNVVDWSGHDHHGTLAGDPQWTGGYAGGALAFDGDGDYVDFATPSDLYLPENYTYCAWFKVGTNIYGNSGAQYLLCIGSRSDLVLGIEDGVSIDGDLSLHYYDTAPGFHAVGVDQIVWNSDAWHMVAATKDAASGHKIYLDGELKGSDSNTNEDNYATTRLISIGARGWTNPKVAFFNGKLDEVRIYDKALTENEIKELMQGNALLAQDPSPARDVTVDIREVSSLSWVAGDTAASHDVYVGADRSAVAQAGTDSPEYQGSQPGTSFALAGLIELGAGDISWRIDEVEADGTVQTGDVWTFTVPDYLPVDDFESYGDDVDAGEAIYQTWIDGWENQTGSLVGYLQATGGTFGETQIVHGGGQSMPLDYNNINSPFYSETEREFAPAHDWTYEGVTALTLYVRGSASNSDDTLYVGVEDSAGTLAVIASDAVLTMTAWTPVSIPLSELPGVDLGRVKKMYIGIGDRNAPAPGGAGLLYIDDIRVTR